MSTDSFVCRIYTQPLQWRVFPGRRLGAIKNVLSKKKKVRGVFIKPLKMYWLFDDNLVVVYSSYFINVISAYLRITTLL